jgi:hypothetical protein
MIFIEAIIDKYDAPPVVIRAGYGTVEIDYAPGKDVQ